ncbi:unnamed protein product [Rhizoctonia solani]|uniref:DUF6535 domain-containing protein n=1 Tax=Rhizoctonia solani TaxID=456999 RepID=A0A8H2XH27_9AGAM|nr:unnamed protein product [Rhizoctonia solani]
MSLLFPGRLSDGGGNLRQPNNYDPPPEIRTASTSISTPSSPPMIQMPTIMDPTVERDEYGAEMGKEARVWRIYVRETDRSDAEVVDGWNKSLDVILVFAALFSAISTAFLIESSQKLQEDPADVTAQTLLVISQALSVLVNTTQPTTSAAEPLPTIDTGSFSPSRIMVAVNTLWYLSLSLSVGTSLLAMLAKDWCHSFMAGRTGHPYSQTIRRQQKWMMIEKWKMQELIMVLPSLIHLSLLLFAIGLCIYVWELNSGVAWPVICVTGASAGFYAWSSIMASTIDYFPYTTVISRFLRSNWTKWMFGQLCCLFRSRAAIKNLYINAVSRFVHSKLRNWLFNKTSEASNRLCITMARMASYILHGIYDSNILGRFKSLDLRIGIWYESLKEWATETEAALPIHIPDTTLQHCHNHQDKIITLALHWLVTSCEAPSAIDAALQAIAGANPQIYREPFKECNAALEISKRLVSGNIYKATDKHVVSLYVRALSFLRSTSSQGSPTQTNICGLGDVQVSLWNLQNSYDKQVTQLIGDGTFTPSDQNIEALGIGSSIASYTLQRLNGLGQNNTLLPQTMCQLLRNHLRDQALHPAALRSLINASELLSICVIDFEVLVQLVDCLVMLAQYLDKQPLDASNPQILDQRTVLRCIYLIGQNFNRRRKDITPDLHSSLFGFAGGMIQDINTSSSLEYSSLVLVPKIVSQIMKVVTHPDLYPILEPHESLQDVINQHEQRNIRGLLVSLSGTQIIGTNFSEAICHYFDDMEYASKSNNDPTLLSQVNLLMTEVLLCTKSALLRDGCSYRLSRSPFPELSPELVTALEKRNIIPLLEQASKNPMVQVQIHAISLLWLLCALESYSSPDSNGYNQLGTQLRRCTAWGTSTVMKRALGYRLRYHWLNLNKSKAWVNLKRYQDYLSRVFECVVEAGDHIVPGTEEVIGKEFMEFRDQLEEHNRHVSKKYRGLASFTAYRDDRAVEEALPSLHFVHETQDDDEPKAPGL